MIFCNRWTIELGDTKDFKPILKIEIVVIVGDGVTKLRELVVAIEPYRKSGSSMTHLCVDQVHLTPH